MRYSILLVLTGFLIIGCRQKTEQSSNGSNQTSEACAFKAGKNSSDFTIAITDPELREKRPHKHPVEYKKDINKVLSKLRSANGLTCETEHNIESYFTAADALYADGRLESANLILFNLKRKLKALQAARNGDPKKAGLIKSEDDILAYRDAHNLHIIDSNYITGAQPTEKGYQWLKEKGVTDIINLRGVARHEKQMIRDMGLNYHHVGWPDMQAPDTAKVNKVKRILNNAEGKAFQHCLRGIGRDLTMSSIIQVARGKDADSVIEHGKHMAPAWAADQEKTEDGTPVQFHFIRQFEEKYHN